MSAIFCDSLKLRPPEEDLVTSRNIGNLKLLVVLLSLMICYIYIYIYILSCDLEDESRSLTETHNLY